MGDGWPDGSTRHADGAEAMNDLSSVWRELQATLEEIRRKSMSELTAEEKRIYQIATAIDKAWREAAK